MDYKADLSHVESDIRISLDGRDMGLEWERKERFLGS